MMAPKFERLDLVYKPKGYKFPGTVLCAYRCLQTDDWRYVVECTAFECAGMQHIFNGDQLELRQ